MLGLLEQGRYVPIQEACPFKDKCTMAKTGECHRPACMEASFSCAVARWFNMEHRKCTQ